MARRPARCYRYCKNKVRTTSSPFHKKYKPTKKHTSSPIPNPASIAASQMPKFASSIWAGRKPQWMISLALYTLSPTNMNN